jgi:hypothetical protein
MLKIELESKTAVSLKSFLRFRVQDIRSTPENSGPLDHWTIGKKRKSWSRNSMDILYQFLFDYGRWALEETGNAGAGCIIHILVHA